jgi:hypothetical protein
VSGISLSFFIDSEERLYEFFRERTASWMSILVILYNELCKKSFQSFLCEELPDGKLFLTTDPSVECGTSSHRIMLGFRSVRPTAKCLRCIMTRHC